MQIKEEWKSIERYEGLYEVSSLGRVRSLDRLVIYSNGKRRIHKGTVLSPGVSNGYYQVSLARGGKNVQRQIHVLVCTAFHLNPEHKRTVNHKDGDKLHNHKDNLEWATHSEQHLHAHANNLKGRNSRALSIEQVRAIKELLKTSITKIEIARRFNISVRTVFNIQNGFTWKKA